MRTLPEARREARSLFLRSYDDRSEPVEHAQRGLQIALNRLALTHITNSRISLAVQELENVSAAQHSYEFGESMGKQEPLSELQKRVENALWEDRNTHERRELLLHEFRQTTDEPAARALVDHYDELRREVVHSVTDAAHEYYQPQRFNHVTITLTPSEVQRIAKAAYQHAFPVIPPERAYGEPEEDPRAVALEHGVKHTYEAVLRKAKLPKPTEIAVRRLSGERAKLVAELMRLNHLEVRSQENEDEVRSRLNHASTTMLAALAEHYGRGIEVARFHEAQLHAGRGVYDALKEEFGDGKPDDEGAGV